MRIIYDPQTDTMNVIFREEKIKESDEVREGIIVDFGFDGKIVGFEILNASEHLTKPIGVTFELQEKNGE